MTNGLSLDNGLAANESEKFNAILKKAREFDIDPIIRRYASKQGVSLERATAVADEMIRYLSICAAEPDGKWTITGEADEMWHTFILFTKKYEEFCGSTAGQIIHHVPKEELFSLRPVPPTTTNDIFESYSKTLDAYKRYLGHPADTTIWPSPTVFQRARPSPYKPREPAACDSGGPGFQGCGCGGKGGTGPETAP